MSKVRLVVFKAEWCGPCKMMSPLLDSLDSIEVETHDLDAEGSAELASKMGVRGVPHLSIMSKDTVLSYKVGRMSKSQLNEWVEEYVE